MGLGRLLGFGKDLWGLGKIAEASDKVIMVAVCILSIYKVVKVVSIKRFKLVDKSRISYSPPVEQKLTSLTGPLMDGRVGR